MGGDREQPGERLAEHAGDLRRGPQRELAGARLPLGEADAVLDRDGGVAVKAKPVSHHHRRSLERRRRVAAAELAGQEEIAPAVLVKDRARAREG